MSQPETRDSLLMRLKDSADHVAWSQFTAIYRPLVYRLARQQGLQDADAQDLAQRVLLAVAGTISRWQPDSDKARFRTWLYKVARNALIDHFRAVRPDLPQGGTTALAKLNDHADSQIDQREVDREVQRQLFRWAASEVRAEFEPSTWSAFWMTAVDRREIGEVAAELGKSVGAVYIARSRVMQRLRECVRDHDAHTMPEPQILEGEER